MCLFLHQHQQVMAPAQGAAGGDGPAHQLAHESNMPPNQALGQPLPINDEPGGGTRMEMGQGCTCMVEGVEGGEGRGGGG